MLESRHAPDQFHLGVLRMRVHTVAGPHDYRVSPQPDGAEMLVLWNVQSSPVENPPHRLPGSAEHDGTDALPGLFNTFLRIAVGPSCFKPTRWHEAASGTTAADHSSPPACAHKLRRIEIHCCRDFKLGHRVQIEGPTIVEVFSHGTFPQRNLPARQVVFTLIRDPPRCP